MAKAICMFRSDAIAGGFGAGFGDFDTVALPLTSAVGGQADFAAVMRETRAEIGEFIQNGSAEAPGLSVEAYALRQRLVSTAGAQSATAATLGSEADKSVTQQQFLREIAPWAREAGERLGVAPELVAAHAALESGWGSRPLRLAQGESSHNLFGIKAGGDWQGAVTDALTTEHVNGADVKLTQRFRAYPDYRSAFNDYAQLLAGNPRFAGVLNVGRDAGAFGAALARGGYATDPDYAQKLQKVAAQIQSPG